MGQPSQNHTDMKSGGAWPPLPKVPEPAPADKSCGTQCSMRRKLGWPNLFALSPNPYLVLGSHGHNKSLSYSKIESILQFPFPDCWEA